MTYDHDLASNARGGRSLPDFRLRYGPIFWRVFAGTIVVLQVLFWLKVIRPFVPFRPRGRRLLLMAFALPRAVVYALLIAAVVTVITDLVFRLLVRPLMRRWYRPACLAPTALHDLPFRLGVGEEILRERPARRVEGRRNLPGTLVLTNRRLYFFPYAWDVESWSLPFEHLSSLRLETPRRRVLGWVSGYPDHLVVHEDSGETVVLIVADPHEILAWFGMSPEPLPEDREVATLAAEPL